MIVDVPIATGSFQFAVKVFKQRVFNFYFASTQPAKDMMMIITCDLIRQMAMDSMRGMGQSIFGEKLKGTVYRWLRDTGQILSRLFINIGWGKVLFGVTKNV
jgi:hypothetical protein